MCKYLIVIFLFIHTSTLTLFAQCIDSKTLEGKLLSLKNTSAKARAIKIEHLLHYESAAEHCPYRNDSIRISLLEYISKLYVEHGKFNQAKEYALKAINIVTGNLQNPGINPRCQVKIFYTLAGIYGALKETSGKMGAYDSCIAVAKRMNVVNRYFLYSLLEKVRYQNNMGDYDLCISQADLGEKYCKRFGLDADNDSDRNTSASYALFFANEKANALLASERPDKAESFLLSKINDCNTNATKDFLGAIYENLALTKIQHKKYDEALKYFNQALISYKKQKDMLSYKCLTHNIGLFYYDVQKNEQKAMAYYKKASKIIVENPNSADLDAISSLNIYSNIGNLFAHKLQFNSAQHYFQVAFDQIKKGINETEVLRSSLDDFIHNQKVEYLVGLFINKGNAFYSQYQATQKPIFVAQAIRMYKLTDRLLERIKSNQLEIQSKLFWRKITHPFYERAIEVCIAAGKTEESFYFFERSRAILLYDEMKEQRGLSKADIQQQQVFRNDIANLKQQLSKLKPGSPDFSNVQIKIAEGQDKQNVLLQKIRLNNPLYFSNFLDSNFISIKETRQAILTDHVLVEIFTGDSSVYSMVITSTELYFNKIDKKDYESLMYHCLSYMSDYRVVNDDEPFYSFLKNSHKLYNLIFQGKSFAGKSIIFSEDGQHFPFETLVMNSDLRNPVYVIQKHPVSYTYSARFLINQFSQDSSFSARDFLGIAPVKFPVKYNLANLQGSDKAIADAAFLFSTSDKLLIQDATKKNFLTRFGNYQIVQLFSHSSDTSENGEPVVYFSDEPLYLSELSNIETVTTKLVILSACETGNGKFYQGEGVFSFNRSFAALGVPSCINNLWSVDNEATYKLSNLFYSNISKGLSIDKALQLAKVDYLKRSSTRNQRPYFWAATILAGRADAIKIKNIIAPTPKNNNTAIIILISLLLLLTAGVIALSKKRQHFTNN